MADVLGATLEWFKRAVPNPTPVNIGVQLGCHFEEVVEMMETIDADDVNTAILLLDAQRAVSNLANHLKSNPQKVTVEEEDRIAFLDAVCDQLVTGTGAAYMLGMKPVDGLAEVNRSNWSKFDKEGQPMFSENMKILKGPNYTRPKLDPFV